MIVLQLGELPMLAIFGAERVTYQIQDGVGIDGLLCQVGTVPQELQAEQGTTL